MLKEMNATEIRDILQVTSKLQLAFRHVKLLCGKYLQVETGVNPFSPYPQFPISPMTFGNPSGFINPETIYQNSPPLINYYDNNKNLNQNINMYQRNKKPPILNNGSKNLVTKKTQDYHGKVGNKVVANQVQRNEKSNQSQKKVEKPTFLSNNAQRMIQQQKMNGNNPKIINQERTIPVSNIPQSPYHLFLIQKKNQIKKEYPQLGQQQLSQIMKQVWNSFKADQKKPYETEYRKLKNIALAKEQRKGGSVGNRPSTFQIAKHLKNELSK